jgi:hypothetical protein
MIVNPGDTWNLSHAADELLDLGLEHRTAQRHPTRRRRDVDGTGM